MNQVTLARLERASHKARIRYQNAKDKYEVQTLRPEWVAKVGTYWRYRNCYSCPKGPEDYWYVYRRIDSINRDGAVTYSEFQRDIRGSVTMEISSSHCAMISMSGWAQTDAMTYTHAFREVTNMVSEVQPKAASRAAKVRTK